MPNIDEKVVKMTFDNQQFEKGVSESLKTIDDLKKALEFDKLGESLKGLESLSTTINNSLNDISNSVKKVENVFTPLGKIVDKELDKIADKVTDATNKFAKMVTGLEGFGAGYEKYNNYTKAVQTITNATGKSVKDVSKVLDVLAKYTDETSYDFAEMVSSIGKFTSVGIELERAEAAMEGIANWAAKSGGNKQQANQAMYNISQAMGAGAMKKQDWNSIVNANMATKEFKETAIQTAIEMGVLQDAGNGIGSIVSVNEKKIQSAEEALQKAQMSSAKNRAEKIAAAEAKLAKAQSEAIKTVEVSYQSFDDTLSEGWLNSEVMTEVLAKYADTTTEFGLSAFKAAQEALTLEDAMDAVKDAVSTNWMKIIKAGLGDLDEARVLMTNIANGIIELSDELTGWAVDIAEGWHEIGGYNTMIEAGTNVWEAFMNIVLGVKEALIDVFPPVTAENLVAITNDIKKATDDLRAAFGIDTEIEVTDTVTETINKATELVQSLKQGDNNRYVKELQNWLVQYGYLDKGQADGIYGPSTVEAVKKLQKAIGVEVTGKWNEATRSAAAANKKFNEEVQTEVTRTLKNVEEVTETYEATINIAKNLNKTLKKGDNNKQVKTLQKVLHKMGLLDKEQANGIFGPETKEAIKKLQQKYGVEVTGMWDDQTRAVAQTKDAFKEVVEKERKVYKETEGLTGPMKQLQDIVKGVFHTLLFVFDLFKGGFEVVKAVFSIFDPLVQVFGRAAGMFANMFTNFHEAIEDGDIIPQWAQNVITFLEPVAGVIDNIAFALDAFITSYAQFLQAYDLENTFGNFFGYLIGYLRQNTILGPVIEILGLVLKYVGKLAKTIIGIVGSVIGWISDKIGSLVGNNGLGKAISESEENNGIISALINIYVTVKYIIGLIVSFIGNAFAAVFGNGSALAEGNKEAESNGIVTFLNGLATVLKVAANIISTGLILIAYGLTMLFGVISKYVTPIIKGIGQIFSGVVSDFNEGKIKSIPDFFNSLWNSFKNADAGKFLIETFEKVKKTISDFFDYIRYVFTPDENGNFNFAEKLKPALEKLNPVIGLFESIKERFSKAWTDFMGIGSTDDVTESKGFVSVLDKVVDFFSKTVPSIVPKLIGPAIAAFATFSLFKGAKALKNISDTLDDGGILGILTGNGGDDDDEDGFADKALKIAGAIAAITASIGILSLIDAGKALKGIGLFALVLGALTGAVILINKFGPDDVNVGSQVLQLAAGIGVLVIALAGLNALVQSNMDSNGNLNSGFITALGIIAGLILELGLIEIAIAALTKGKEGANDIGGILKMCLGVGVLVLALGKLSEIVSDNVDTNGDLKKSFVTALEIIAGMILSLGIIEMVLNYQASKNVVGYSKAKVSGVLGLAAAVYVLVLAFEKMIKVVKKSGMEESELHEVFWGIEIMVGTLGLIAILLGAFSKEGISTLGTAAELLAMGLMTKMVVGAFAEAILMTKGADPELMKIFFVGIETALGVLSAIVIGFGNMPVATFIGEAGLLGLLGVITAGIDMISGVTATAMDRFAGGLMQVGKALKYFGDDADQMNWDAINKVWDWIKNSLPTLIKDFVSLQSDVATASNMAMDLWSFGYSLFLYSDIISQVGDEGIKGTQEAYEMVVWAKEVADYIETITMPQDVMNGNLTFLAGHLLLYSNLMDDVSNNNSQNAIDLVTDAKTIADKINEVEINNGYESAKALVALGVAIKLYYQSLSKVGKTDVFDQPLAEGEEFDPSDVVVDTDTIKRAFEALADAIPDKDTVNLLSGMKEGGDYDMIDASLGIGALGEALEAYGNNLNSLKLVKVKNANLALKGITDLDTHIKETKVVEAKKYMASNSDNISSFSGHIITLGDALKDYGERIGDLDDTKIGYANTVLEEFAKLDQQLNRNDNFWTDIWGLFGDTTIDIIEEFGQKLTSFVSGLLGIENGEAVRDLGLMSGPFRKIETNAAKGASSANSASNKLIKHGQAISQVGQSLRAYNASIADLNETKTTLASGVLTAFADLAEALPKLGGLVSFFEGDEQSLQIFSTGFESVGRGLVEFQTGAEGLDVDKLEPAMTTIERIISWGKEFDDNFNVYNSGSHTIISTSKFEQMAEGIANSVESLARIATGKDLFGQEVEAPAITVFASLGDALTSALTRGISTGSNVDTNITTAINEVIGKIKTEVESYDTEFYNIGEYIAKGIVGGVVGSFTLVSKVFEALGLKAMVEPTQEAVEVNSPSRKFKWIAQMCALGLKYGFEDYSYLVEDATLDLANSSLNTIAAAFDESRVADAGQGALDGLKSVLLSTKAPEKIKKMMSDILVGAGYLKESDISNVEAYTSAVKKYKEEVLGDENATATWGYADSVKLWNTVSRTLGKNNNYNALEYEKEMLDALGAKYDDVIGQKTKLLGDKMQNKYAAGNIDLRKKQTLSAEAMKAAGWDGFEQFDGRFVSVLDSMIYTAGDNKAVSKKYKKLIDTYNNLMIESYKSGNTEQAKEYEDLIKEAKKQAKSNKYDFQYDSNIIASITPVLSDGTTLSPEGLEAYFDTLLDSGRDIIEADKKENGGLGIVINVDNADSYKTIDEGIQSNLEWLTKADKAQESYFNSLEKEKKQLNEVGEAYDDYIIKRHEVLKDANGKEVGFVNYDTKNQKHLYLSKEMEEAGYTVSKDKKGNDVITNTDKQKKEELERIKKMQAIAERHGYLRKDSYTSGVMDTPTIVAMNALEKDLYGKANETTKWTAKDQKKLDKAIEHYGSEDKLFEAKTGSKSKPEKFLDEMDKRIEKKDAENQKKAEDTYIMQQILEAYGYLGTNHYTPGSNGKITSAAAIKFRKEILGETGTNMKYGPLTDEEMAHLSEVIDQYGDENTMLKALSSNNVKKQRKLNEEGNEELSKLLAIYGENADIKKKTTTDKNGISYTRYGITKRGEVTALQEIMEEFGFLATGTYKKGKSDKPTEKAWNSFIELLDLGKAIDISGADDGSIKLDSFQQKKVLDMLAEYGGWNKLVSKKQQNKPASRNTGFDMEEWMFGSVYAENALDINSTISTIGQYADSIESELTTRAYDLKKKLVGDGENSIISQYEDQVISKVKEVNEAVVGNAAGILAGDKSIDDLFTSEEAQNQVKESSKTLFSNIPKGATEAIEEHTGYFQSALEGMVEAGHETIEDTEDMHSPSQVYYEYGQLLIQGLINGVNSKSDDLRLAIANACNNAYVGAQLALIGLNNAINSSDVATPKIRPIIEASSDQSGSGYTLRNGNAYTDPLFQITTSITGIQTIAAGMQTNVQEMKKSIDDSNTAIIQQFNNLNSHLDDIDRDILNMKIYLDSDAMVAGTVTKMGRALGRRQFVASRQ